MTNLAFYKTEIFYRLDSWYAKVFHVSAFLCNDRSIDENVKTMK